MHLCQKIFLLSFLACSVQHAMAQTDESTTVLKTIKVHSKAKALVNTQVVKQDQLVQGATTIGKALDGQAGIASAQYAGGVSRPVVRGQEGARVKITQNGGDVLDVSSVSPDHAVTVDPNAAQEIQLLQGADVLLYGAGSVGGLINVIDNKVPDKMPLNGYEGHLGTRYNSGSDEMLYSGDVTMALGQQVALKVGGLTRNANNYILPQNMQHDGRREESTFAKSDNYNAGLSWIYDRGFTGISFSQRHDQYGIPGESEAAFSPDPITHLLTVPVPQEESSDASSWINLKQKRYDIKTQLNNPFSGFSKLTAQANYTTYQHAEMAGNVADTVFHSKGTDARVTLDTLPWAGWTGQVGTQFTQQKLIIDGEEALMAPTDTKRYSIFGLQAKQFGQVNVKLSSRIDHQNLTVESDQKDFKGTAYSGAAEATWAFTSHHKLSLNASHQERLPMAQELYSNGGLHGATKTYEFGNDGLTTEKSNNLSLGLHGDYSAFKYNVNVYQNWFSNFIYAQTLDRDQDFRVVHYTQDQARFYGVDADASYQLSSVYNIGIFGDYVRGKIDGNNAPRVPAGRLGTRLNTNFGDGYTATAEYSHVFKQDKIASYETNTSGYNLLNFGLAYNGKINDKTGYRLYTKANNVLDSKIYEHQSFLADVPQVGRNFTVGVDFNF